MKKSILCALLASSLSMPAYANNTSITIYSKAQPGAMNPNSYRPVAGAGLLRGSSVPGYAVVRQTRNVSLPKTENILKFSDVAGLIDPTTVQFKSLTDPKTTKVTEQDYQFDLVSQAKLLEKYIDKSIVVEKQAGDKLETVTGTLMSTQGGLTLRQADGTVKIINGYSSISFPEMPGGLMTKPTLVWDIITSKPGEHNTEVSYQTEGITWWADYNLTYKEGKDANSGTVDLGSWVSIINQTGTTFEKAALKLMAGDVQRAQPQMAYDAVPQAMEMRAAVAPSPKFTEKAFFEYHLYTLNRPVTLPDNATKQMELIPAAYSVPVEKELIYNGSNVAYAGYPIDDQNYGASGNKKVDVYLKLKNKEENGMGVPLPAGRIRVNQSDDDGSLEFIGENIIDHTARNEELRIKLGSAFDVVGERKQVSYKLDNARRSAQEEIEVRVRNQKKQAVKVRIIEPMYRATGWEITQSSEKFTKDNAHQISYVVDIAPEKEALVKYSVKYSW